MLPKMPERASSRVGGLTKAAMLGNTIVEGKGPGKDPRARVNSERGRRLSLKGHGQTRQSDRFEEREAQSKKIKGI